MINLKVVTHIIAECNQHSHYPPPDTRSVVATEPDSAVSTQRSSRPNDHRGPFIVSAFSQGENAFQVRALPGVWDVKARVYVVGILVERFDIEPFPDFSAK